MIVAKRRFRVGLVLPIGVATCLTFLSATVLAQSAASPDRAGPVTTTSATTAPDTTMPAGSVMAAPADTGGDIIVTAQRREQRLQDVPIAITALSGANLVNRGVGDTSQIGKVAAGVQITAYGASPTVTLINIRGVVQLDFADHQESPNAVYVDGAYVSFQGATGIGLYDVDRLEVLRGPQGTLFGRNATGGLVQIISRKPSDTLSGYVQGTYGRYDQARAEGAIGGGLTDTLSARAAFLFNRQDGYIHNVSGRDGGADKTINGRVQLRWRPTSTIDDNLEIFGSRTFTVGGGVYDAAPTAQDPANHNLSTQTDGPLFADNCAALGYPPVAAGSTNCLGYRKPDDGPYRVDAPQNGIFRRAIWGATNTLVANLDGPTLTSITNYSHIRKNYQEDSDASPLVIGTYNPRQTAYQASQELRLSQAAGRFRWTIGGYYLHIFGRYRSYLDLSDVFGFAEADLYTQKVDTYAVFGEAELDLTGRLTAIGGVRWTRDKKQFVVNAVCGADDATCLAFNLAPTGTVVGGTYARNDWSGKAQLTWKLSPAALLYAGVTRGNKGSLLQAPSIVTVGTTFDSLVVRPEVLTSYEAGIKTTLINRRVTANLSGFYYDYHNFQAFNFVNLNGAIFNAEARNYGGELEVNADLRHGLSGGLGIAYLHTRVKNVSLPDGTLADQRSAFSPKLSIAANVRQEVRSAIGTFFAQPSLSYAGSRYFSTINAPALKAGAYLTGDISIGLIAPDRKWDATVFVRNVTDKHYITYAGDLTSVAGFVQRNYSTPRTASVQVGYRF